MFRTVSRLLAGASLLGALTLSGSAQAKFVFPYNHPDLDWYSIETEHFVVHYPVSKKTAAEGNEHYLTAEYSARKSAQVAEEMWPKMCGEFNYYLKEQVHIVLLNQSDDLEGFTIPPWDWIEISANPGGTFYRMRGRMEWFADVLVHEFAHVVSLKANAPFAEGTQAVSVGGLYKDGINNVDVGAEIYFADGDSVFWTEGGAEYWSDQAGYNWWTASRDQNIRMTVLEDRLLEYDEWHTRANKSDWGDGERYYQQGYSFGQYLRQRFGDKTYASFAHEYGKGWRPAWESVIEDVLGVDAETLYNDWRAYVTQRYNAQYDRVKARGEVVGREVIGAPADWDFTDPEARDAWTEKYPAWRREDLKENTSKYATEPRISPDGKYVGILNFATLYEHVSIFRSSEDQMYEWTGYVPGDPARSEEAALLSTAVPADFEHGWDFVPGKDAVVVTGREDSTRPSSTWKSLTNITLEVDGYNWKELIYYDLPTREKKDGNRTVTTRERKHTLNKREKYEEGSWRTIPNTKRGFDPAVSPDGSKVAYFEYTDGTLNLVTINLDGSDKKHLTNFKDGTWLQKVDWSPDGKQLVFGIFKNYVQNLYVVNADGSNLHAITWDQWEEMDPHWSKDGRIYFAAEPDGIFNVYAYDPASDKTVQITNVIGGATNPQISPEGNLLFAYYTAHGWKIHGLPKEQFLNAPADHLFVTGKEIDQEEVKVSIAFAEDLSKWAESTKPYRAYRSFIAPTAVPMFRVENESRTDWGLISGFQVFFQDYVEKHGGAIYTLLGEDPLFMGQYFYQGWYPNLYLMAYHYEIKYGGGYLLDQDQDTTTSDDQDIYEIRNSQYVNIASAAIEYPWNGVFSTTAYGQFLEFGIKGTDSGVFERYMQGAEAGLTATFSNNAFLAQAGSVTFGRTIDVTGAHGWTDVVYEPYGGAAVDDGQLLDAYEYNKGELRWVEQIPMPTLGIPLLEDARRGRHVFQLDARLGATDRNVDGQDEFHAGGQHPYQYGYGNLRPNTLFAGYPNYSLSGETMAIFNLAYRFPIAEHFYKRIGPLYTYGVYFQMAGTAGNLWSFRPPEDAGDYYLSRYGERIARDADAVTREIPFVDEAYKNGNSMLYDASAELRVRSVIFHGMPWDSFARVAYGFNEIRGYGDVNGDDLFDTSENALGDELSNETEPAGFRYYIGFGTGW